MNRTTTQELMNVLQDWISAVEDWVPMLAESLWVYPALTLFALVDGFFPPVPSESVVIALASLSVAQGSPNIFLVALAGAVGAFAGDQIAYLIGSRVDVHRLRLFRGPRGARTLAWAEHALANRGSSFILAARYIPIGRVAVNMTAGALGYPRRRFVGLTGLAAVTWAAYGTLVGAGAGIWLADHPVIAVVAGVVVGTLVGIGIDWVLRRWTGLFRTPAVVVTPPAHPVEPAEPGAAVPTTTPAHGVAAVAAAGTPGVTPPRAPVPAQGRVTSRQRSGPAR
ncbi:DedA family protein [Cellulomonas sp. Marseille-Q8402]